MTSGLAPRAALKKLHQFRECSVVYLLAEFSLEMLETALHLREKTGKGGNESLRHHCFIDIDQ